MRIGEIRIHNYRSIKDLKVECRPLLTLVGPNNSGKSNILGALEFVLAASVKPSADDLFAYHDVDDAELWVELEFADLSEQEARTFAAYVKRSKLLRIRRTARFAGNGKAECTYNGYLTEPKQWWLRSSAWTRLSSRDLAKGEVVAVPELQPLADAAGRLTKPELDEFQNLIIESRDDLEWETTLETGPLLGRENVTGGILPDFFLVPAVRELADETKAKGTSLLGRLLQRIVSDVAGRAGPMQVVEQQLQAAVAQLNVRPGVAAEGGTATIASLEADLESELAHWGVSVSIKVEAPTIDRIFEQGTRVLINDGHETEADRKGHGLQRALIFALLRTWAKAARPAEAANQEAVTARKASSSAVFAVEEPELFLHPHAQRRLYGVLRSLSELPERQVFLCTHSPAFINIEDYRGLGIVCKDDPKEGTRTTQCTQDLFGAGDEDEKARFHMAGWLNPDRGELFFARQVVLVEGETEERVLPMLASKRGRRADDVSVIDCGGKNNLVAYVKLVNEFRIPYVVVHDEDPIPDPVPSEWNADKIKHKRATFAENARILTAVDPSLGTVHLLSPCFEDVAGVSKSQGEKVGKAMAAVTFFKDHEVPPKLADVIDSIFPAPRVATVVTDRTGVPE